MPAPPEISVLLPYRDAEATLAEAVASVLAQEGPRLELLAVDDGSRDGGPSHVAELARRDPRVRPLASHGRGLVAALEVARAAAGAPLLARMDADDVSLPGRFAAQVSALRAAPSVAAMGCRVEAFPADAVAEGLARYVAWQNELISPEDHARELFVESPLCHPSVLLRAEAVAAIGGYRDGPFPEDYDLFLRLWSAGYGLAKAPHLGLRWRHLPGRLTFRDPRYSHEAFRLCKAGPLAAVLLRGSQGVVFWGAGREGRRLARALALHGVEPAFFVDIDPKKIGRTARNRPITSPEALQPGSVFVVVAVGARGARALIRESLAARGFVEGRDFLCAA